MRSKWQNHNLPCPNSSRGHKQIEVVNYTETFSAAAKLPLVCVVLANAVMPDWEIHQVDIKSAYLNAPVNEMVYMEIPRGAAKPGQEK